MIKAEPLDEVGIFRYIISMLIISEQTIGRHENSIYRVAARVRELNAAINSRISESLTPTGLTLPQLLLIKVLAHNGPITISEIARDLSVSTPTAVGIVDRLERHKLVERKRDNEDDRREVRVEFAPGSEERLRGLRETVDAAMASAFSDIPKSDLDLLERALETAAKALGNGR